MQLRHAINKDADIFSISCINKSLDISYFVFFEHSHWQQVVFHLQQVHQQTAGTPIAICPWMYGHQFVVSPKTEVIDSTGVCLVDRNATFVQFFTKSGKT